MVINFIGLPKIKIGISKIKIANIIYKEYFLYLYKNKTGKKEIEIHKSTKWSK